MTRRLPRILDLGILSPVELRAAVLDGELGMLGEAFAITDAPPTPSMRAASLARAVPERGIIADRCAAWVWGWTPESSPLRLCVSKEARISSPTRRMHRAREVAISPDEVHELGGVAITSPERTLVDLARFDEGDDVIELLAAGIVVAGMEKEVVDAALDRRPASAGLRRARQRLEAARELSYRGSDYPLLTRYTS